MLRFKFYQIILFSTFNFIACTISNNVTGTISSTEDGTIGLFGKILSDSGVPQSGVNVSIYKEKDTAFTEPLADTVTNDSGNYVFTYLSSGRYNIQAQKKSDSSDFYILLKDINYDSSASSKSGFDVGVDTIKLSGVITGMVSLGSSIKSDVLIYIPGTSFYAYSDSSGSFTMNSVAAGENYSLKYVCEGFKDTTILNITVLSDSTTFLPLVRMYGDLISYWNLDGNAEEENGQFSGTLMGTTDTVDRFGNSADAMYFDKASIVKIPDDSLLAFTASFSISLWYNKENHDSSDRDFLVFRGAEVSGKDSYFLSLEKSGEWIFHIENEAGQSNKLKLQSNSSHFGKWVHLAAVFNAENQIMKLYFDGVEEANLATSVSPFGILQGTEIFIRIGGYRATSEFGINGETGLWLGGIDDVKFYNYALTTTQIVDLSQN